MEVIAAAINQAQLKSTITSPRRRSPSKNFTRLVKRDSDSTVLLSQIYNSKLKLDSVQETSSSLTVSITDDCCDYHGSGNDSDKNDENPLNRNQFDEFYNLGTLIGEGASSKVYCVTGKDGCRYAAKVLPTRKIFTKDFKIISKEIAIIKTLNHKNIIKLHECFITLDNVYIVMDFVDGKELFDEMLERRICTEDYTKKIIRQILDPLIYLHQNNIAHRDLKPENIKFHKCRNNNHNTSNGGGDQQQYNIKLLDFGFAGYLMDGGNSEVISVASAGTLGYEAPEILTNSTQTCAVDMWSLGVILYTMLCGQPPFVSYKEYHDEEYLNYPFWMLFNDDTSYLRTSITNASFNFSNNNLWKSVSDNAKEFISLLLHPNSLTRLKAIDAINHPWFNN